MGAYIINVPSTVDRIIYINVDANTGKTAVVSQQIEDLTPYAEPDLEQIKKEAYEQGYDDAKSGYDNGFENGMIVAWEAARKILSYGKAGGKLEVLTDVFSDADGWWDIINKYTATEAIEKIRQYEQEQEYHVGNEFENGAGQKYVVLKMDGKEIDRYMDGDGKTYVMDVKYSVMRKTGRHFPEIAEVLQKMREGQEQ